MSDTGGDNIEAPRLNLRRNAIWGLLEIVCAAVVLFLLYRLVLAQLGLQALGIWSLVLAATSLVRLGDLGAASGLGRFVAVAYSRGEGQKALAYIETAIITNTVLFGAVSLILYWPLWHLLPLSISSKPALEQARSLLPYALLSFTMLNVNGAMNGSVMGLQRADLKSGITVASTLLQFAVAAILTAREGLIGLAVAQISQYAFSLLAQWFVVLRQLRLSPRLPQHWERRIFRELLGFGIKLQAASLLSFLYEPAVKFVLSSLGGLGALGVFELAQKVVQQVRQVVVGPSQILMPAFAHFDDKGGSEVATLYEKAIATSVITGLPLMTAVALGSPLIAWLLIGHVDPRFVTFIVMLCVGWFLNLVAAPAYLLGVGTGRVGWNIWGHVITTLGGPALGLVLGHLAGANGVVAGAMLMLATGSLFSMIMNCASQSCAPLPGKVAMRSAFFNLWRLRPKGKAVPPAAGDGLASSSGGDIV